MNTQDTPNAFEIFTSSFALSVLLGVSQATRCYVCSSVTDSACLDPYAGDSLHEDNCTGLDAGCSKHKSEGKVLGFDFKERKQPHYIITDYIYFKSLILLVSNLLFGSMKGQLSPLLWGCTMSYIWCLVLFAVNRKCSSRFDNLICDHRDWFDFEWPRFEDTKVWQCSCTGDLCNSCHHVTASFTALLSSISLGKLDLWK